ncbi:unnamed protein product [Closterium sp. NIES-64]|nr:unnamed protein product [Closterium sp. NIES-64]
MSHSKQPRSQGKRKDGKNRPRGGVRGGAESSIGDPFALSEERLVSLDLEGGLNQRRDYSEACRELSLLLRLCYSLSPKHVQSHLYFLAQQAIANLPCMDGALHRSAARQLIQACQAALPRQRKQAVTAEYKRLCVMLARAEKKSESAVEEEEEEEEEEGDEQQQQEANDFNGSSKQASAVCFHWREIAAAAEPDWVTHLAACLGSMPAAEARESRDGKGRAGGEVQEGQTPLWQEFVSQCARATPLSSLQSNRVLCRECSMVAWTPNAAPTPSPHATTPSSPSVAPSLATATLSSAQFFRGKNKGRGGIVTPGNISAGTGVGVGVGASGKEKELEPVAGAAWLVVLLLELEGRVKWVVRPWTGMIMQQHVWKLAGTAKVVASLSDEFEGEESSDEDGVGVGRTGYRSNASTVSRFW